MNLLNMNSIKNDYYVLNSNNNSNNFKSNESPLAMIKMLNGTSNKPAPVSSLIITPPPPPPPQSQSSSIVVSINSNNNNNNNTNSNHKLNTNVNTKRTNRFQFLNPNTTTTDINRTSLQINPNVNRQSSNHNLHFQHLNLNSNSNKPATYTNNVNIQLKPTTNVKTSTASTTIQKLIKLDDFSGQLKSGNNYVIKYPKVAEPANIYDEIESDSEMKHYYSTIFDIKTPPRATTTNKLHQLSAKINCFKSHNPATRSNVEKTQTTQTPYRYLNSSGSSSSSSSSGLSDISTPESSSSIDLKNLLKKCTTGGADAANEAYFSLNMIKTTKINPNIIRNARSPVISSGYNSSQESSAHNNSLPSSGHNTSTRRLVFNESEFIDDEDDKRSLNNLDSGISTLNLLNDALTSSSASGSDVDATSNLSAYLSDNQLSANSPFLSSKSSINPDYDELEMQTSPFPKVKTCLIAQVKQINRKPQAQVQQQYYYQEPIYENLSKYSKTLGGATKQKQYSINDVLHSLRRLESNAPTSDYEEDLLCDGEVDFYLNQNPQYFNYNYCTFANNNHCQYNSRQSQAPARKSHQPYNYNYYNDEAKKTVKSMAASFMSNNKPIALWEQLV